MSLIIFKHYHIAKSIIIALMLQNSVENAGSLLLGLKACFRPDRWSTPWPRSRSPSWLSSGRNTPTTLPRSRPLSEPTAGMRAEDTRRHSTDGIRDRLVVITRQHDCRGLFYGTHVYIGMQISNANVLPYLHKHYTQFKYHFWLRWQAQCR